MWFDSRVWRMGNFDITWSTIQNCVRFHQLNHLEALILLVIQHFSNFLGHFHYLANRQQKSKWAGQAHALSRDRLIVETAGRVPSALPSQTMAQRQLQFSASVRTRFCWQFGQFVFNQMAQEQIRLNCFKNAQKSDFLELCPVWQRLAGNLPFLPRSSR